MAAKEAATDGENFPRQPLQHPPAMAQGKEGEGVRMRNDQIKVTFADHHRNGISGIGFYVCLFDWKSEGEPVRHMIATMHDGDDDEGKCNGYIAVLDRDMVAQGNVKFFENSWRGDNFEPELRKQAEAYVKANRGY